MLLNEIAFIIEEVDAKEQKLIDKVRAAKAELSSAKSKAASFQQSGAQASHKSVLAKHESAVKAAQQELENYKKSRGAAGEARAAEKERESKRASETEEQKKERLGKSISAGQAKAKEIKTGEEGEKGKDVAASKVYAYVVSASKEGQEKVTAGDIAHHFDTTARTVNRWLEQPEFTKVARLLGRR